ncbi:lipopolysaccharide assembly protein LapA domain-containing protein [Furfurilactobacillus curtus]|uniref:Lipopolysaccharide assembly protein A domain-containing protein n=1 Tax=Furfurilactobacillus curtus TaxID=1746200 RepID=A0ABQ5JLE3_9LACO
MRNQWRLVVGLLLVLIIAIFAVMNGNSVPIHFGFTTVRWPMILILIVSLLLGALITVLVSAGGHHDKEPNEAKVGQENVQLKQQNQTLTQKNNQLDQLIKQREQTIETLQQQLGTKSPTDDHLTR